MMFFIFLMFYFVFIGKVLFLYFTFNNTILISYWWHEVVTSSLTQSLKLRL